MCIRDRYQRRVHGDNNVWKQMYRQLILIALIGLASCTFRGSGHWVRFDRCDPKWVRQIQGGLFDCADPTKQLPAAELERVSRIIAIANFHGSYNRLQGTKPSNPGTICEVNCSPTFDNRYASPHLTKDSELRQKLYDKNLEGAGLIVEYKHHDGRVECVLIDNFSPNNLKDGVDAIDSRGRNLKIPFEEVNVLRILRQSATMNGIVKLGDSFNTL
eukprot:TRINITY_DN3935_c0_g1_i2.p1 TRINITY_DN3935_c0_g1~~TRINITY_DN3935_c0_g1_i2.p1  ORF type:complete len:216 (+),score=45.41 TRINITY_DN3935_c0_g1_i2:64-711(+)